MVLGTKKTLNICMYHGSALKGRPPDIRLAVPTQFLSLDVMGSLILLDPDSVNLSQHFFSHFSLPQSVTLITQGAAQAENKSELKNTFS